MSEIDKLINQAFPDELRDIEPIDVDEDAILAMTLEQLGLEPDSAEPPDTAAARPLRRLTERHGQKAKGEPELIEVPVVVHHRWMDWAGWAIAACLVLAFAVNWGPWLINNLDFGIGPRSAGNITVSGSGVADEYSTGDLVRGGTVRVSISSVEYGEEDTMTITLFVNDLGTNELPDLDKLEVSLTSGGKELERVGRSNVDRKISVTYRIDGVNSITLTVRQLIPSSSGEALSWTYEDVEVLSMDLIGGSATSRFDGGKTQFSPKAD